MHIDVREEIAALGAVSGRTVSNVKTILGTAAPAVIAALHSGMLKINRALQWCRLTGKEQLDRLTEHHIARDRYKAIRHAIAVAPAAVGSLSAVLESLRQHEARVPGSVSIRIGTGSRTEILLGQDFLSQPETIGGFIQ